MLNTYVVRVGNASFCFNNGNCPFTLSELEKIIRYSVQYNDNLNTVATALGRDYRSTVLATELKSYKYDITLSYDTISWTWKVRITNQDNVKLYEGSLLGFSEALAEPNWKEYKDKVVRFVYEGGSNPNSTRLVKVQSYANGNLETVDLEKEQPRNFDVKKIKNLKIVAN